MAAKNAHDAFKALGPIGWNDAAGDEAGGATDMDFLQGVFSSAQTLIGSVPAPATGPSGGMIPRPVSTTGTRPRSHTEGGAAISDLARMVADKQQTRPGLGVAAAAEQLQHQQQLRKEWKEVKVAAKDNPLDIGVYKLAAKDGKGSWFARRSVHHGLTFDKWRLGLEREFAETMKVQGQPGSGNVRGIGAERMVENRVVSGVGKMEGMLDRSVRARSNVN